MPFHQISRVEVLYEDNHLLAVNKPAHLATMGLEDEDETLLGAAKEYIRRKYDKPGKVFLGIVSRLDAPVTGVVIIARTSKAAARLTEQFKERQVEKVYWAIVEGRVEPRQATLEHWLRHDERHRRMHATTPNNPDALQAVLDYRVCEIHKERSLLEVRLETGRKHQIRVQLAKIGHPILGDQKYGSQRKFPSGIALHSRRLVIEHPVQKTPLEIVAPTPKAWENWRKGG